MAGLLHQRQAETPAPGVIWITGLSGSGKTTVARALTAKLRTVHPAVLLDGDEMRAILGKTEAFSADERRALAFTYARLARHLADQGLIVVCATISMFHDVRAWSRENIGSYFEVYLRVPDEQRIGRDAKGLYKAQTPATMVGLAADYEEPRAPDLLIDNYGATTAETAIDRIWQALTRR